ncbi:MAG: CoA-binding protein [Verrucomicrobia bacterium]|jgi:uncharacterized protein|nr:CoA-binding protein [Verrucomicrobiota bacterium]
MKQTVAIIGASDKPDRYAYRVAEMLESHGHQVVLVNPFKEFINGGPCLKDVLQFDGTLDTVTVYVNATRFLEHLDSILEKKPRRIIFNPGAEAPEAYPLIEKEGVLVEEACTLVLLNTGQF